MVELEGRDRIEARTDSPGEIEGAAESERDDRLCGGGGERPRCLRRPFIVAYGLSRSTLESLAFRGKAMGLLDAMAAKRGGPWQRQVLGRVPVRLPPRLPTPARGVINRTSGGATKAPSIPRASKPLPRFTGRHVPAVRFNGSAVVGEDVDDDVSILSDDDSLARSRGAVRKRS